LQTDRRDVGSVGFQGEAVIRLTFASRHTILQYAVVLLLFMLFALPKVNQPVTDDEIYEIDNAERILSGEPIRLFLPPLYDYALALSIKLLGREPWVMRLLGLSSALASICILMALVRILYRSAPPSVPILAGALLALNPAFVQGSLLVHIDNTLLVPLTLLWIWFLLSYSRTNSARYLAWAGVSLTLALLAKFTTPLLLIFAGFLFVLLNHPQKALPYTVMAVFSVMAFLLGWWLFSELTGLSFFEPFTHAVQRGAHYSEVLTQRLITFILNALTLGVWFTPFFLLSVATALPAALKGVASRRDPAALFLLSSAAIFSYLAFSVVNHGFPKYFMPALPLLVLVVIGQFRGNSQWRQWPLHKLVLCFAGAATIFFLFLEDPVLLLRYDLRETEVLGTGGKELVLSVLWQTFLCLAVLGIWYLRSLKWPFSKRVLMPTFSSHVLILSLAFSGAVSMKQSIAPYQTNYSYGERGTLQLHAYLTKHLRATDQILATKDILYRLGRSSEFVPNEVWSNPTDLFQRLVKPETRFLVISIPSNSVGTHTMIENDPDLRATIATKFIKRHIGTYTVYGRIAMD
jgi:4-amino-4-deoxy-L-arabinose transferase-like glycosyltransferase